MDTTELVHQYYLEKLREQKGMLEATDGVLTVKLIFIDNVLRIDILNAHRLKSKDSSGMDVFDKQ